MATDLEIDLVLEQITRRFPPDRLALDGITTQITFGETVAIVGPSGSGKSTLLALLGLLDRPSSGRYLVGGIDTASLSEKKRTQMRAHRFGFVFQAFHLVPYLTALENVEVGLAISGVPRVYRSRIADSALRKVGMEKRASTRALTLSGGEQQRVAIARAIAREPAVLFCDEPTGNLDSANAEMVLSSIFSAGPRSQRRTTIVVTHNQEVAAQCDRSLRIVDGILSPADPIGAGQ